MTDNDEFYKGLNFINKIIKLAKQCSNQIIFYKASKETVSYKNNVIIETEKNVNSSNKGTKTQN